MGSLYDLIEAENLNEERSKRPVNPETWHRARIIVNEGHVEQNKINKKLLDIFAGSLKYLKH